MTSCVGWLLTAQLLSRKEQSDARMFLELGLGCGVEEERLVEVFTSWSSGNPSLSRSTVGSQGGQLVPDRTSSPTNSFWCSWITSGECLRAGAPGELRARCGVAGAAASGVEVFI